MTFGGWCTFLMSTLTVTALLIWCLSKVLSVSRRKQAELRGAFDLSDEADETRGETSESRKPKSTSKKKKGEA